MRFAILSEAAKGISDLPIAILSFVFFSVLAKDGKKSHWTPVFGLLSIVSLLGAVAHIFEFSYISHNILWSIVYLVMDITILLTHYAFVSDATENREPVKKHKKMLQIISAIAYPIILVFLWAVPDTHLDMIVFVIYAFLMILPIILVSFKKSPIARKLRCIVLMLLITGILQGFKPFQSFSIVVEHIIILFALVITFSIAYKSQTIEEGPSE